MLDEVLEHVEQEREAAFEDGFASGMNEVEHTLDPDSYNEGFRDGYDAGYSDGIEEDYI